MGVKVFEVGAEKVMKKNVIIQVRKAINTKHLLKQKITQQVKSQA
jgi:hypothetical protein